MVQGTTGFFRGKQRVKEEEKNNLRGKAKEWT